MSKKQASPDPHPIRTNIIGSLVAAIVTPLIVSLIPGAWSFLAKCVTSFYLWSISDHSISGWMMTVFMLCAALVLFIGLKLLRGTSSKPDWRGYITDEFFGLIWHWNYYGHDIASLACFCPKCSMQVNPQNRSSFTAVDRIGFYCEHCEQDRGEFEESWEDLENKVIRSIQRKLRTNEWQLRAASED